MDIMGFLGRFRRKTVVEPLTRSVKKEPSELKQICIEYGEEDLYEDLSHSVYLNPRGRGTYEEAMKKAEKEVETRGNTLKTKANFQHAGALAMYEGNVAGVKEAFDIAAESPGRKYERIRENPEKAVEIVQEYYRRVLKPLSVEEEN